MSIKICDLELVGANHVPQKQTVLGKAPFPGVPCTLFHDRENRFDRNAISVRVLERHVGYIAREHNFFLTQMLKAGIKFNTYVGSKYEYKYGGVTTRTMNGILTVSISMEDDSYVPPSAKISVDELNTIHNIHYYTGAMIRKPKTISYRVDGKIFTNGTLYWFKNIKKFGVWDGVSCDKAPESGFIDIGRYTSLQYSPLIILEEYAVDSSFCEGERAHTPPCALAEFDEMAKMFMMNSDALFLYHVKINM